MALLVFSPKVNAQSLLLPGDVLVVSVNSDDNSIDILPLVDIEPNTTLSISNGTWSNEQAKFLNGEKVTYTILDLVPAGQTLHLSNLDTENFSMEGELSVGKVSDQIFVYQVDESQNRFITGLFWEATNQINITYPKGDIPETLALRDKSFVSLGMGNNFQYRLRYGASGTPGMLNSMIYDPNHWQSKDSYFEEYRTSFRILNGPVVVFDTPLSRYKEGRSIFIPVHIYGHDGSRLTLDAAVNFETSSVDTNDVLVAETYTINFTGLIGDASNILEIPQKQDEIYEGVETLIVEISNISAGQFGDFVSHAVLIQDDELPNISISKIEVNEVREFEFVELRNEESIPVTLSSWSLNVGEVNIELPRKRLLPFETTTILWDNLTNEDVQVSLNEKVVVNLLNSETQIISEYSLDHESKELEESLAKRQEVTVITDEVILEESSESATVSSIHSSNTIVEQDFYVNNKWLTVTIDELQQFPNEEFIYWNEQTQEFSTIRELEIDSLQGLTLFALDVETSQHSLQPVIISDTVFQSSITDVEISDIGTVEQTFFISATDSDQNGKINGIEGLNFLRNDSKIEIPVSHLISSIESQTVAEAVQTNVYSWAEDGSGWQGAVELTLNQTIAPNTSFWVKIDSLLAPTSVSIELDETLIPEYVEEIQESEPSSSFVFEVTSGNLTDTLSIYFFDDDLSQIPTNEPTPWLNFDYQVGSNNFMYSGVYDGSMWSGEINSAYRENEIQYYPIAIRSNEDRIIEFSVIEFGFLPSEWAMYLEHIETKERLELTQNFNHEFEFKFEAIEDENLELNAKLTESLPAKLSQIYNLVIVPAGVEEPITDSPEIIELFQNYPNPFNPVTTISFYLPETEEVKLSVFNVVGQPVAVLANGSLGAGEHQYDWDATGFPSGMYIYQLEIKNQIMTRKMTLVK